MAGIFVTLDREDSEIELHHLIEGEGGLTGSQGDGFLRFVDTKLFVILKERSKGAPIVFLILFLRARSFRRFEILSGLKLPRLEISFLEIMH